jgi:hypothetical protein
MPCSRLGVTKVGGNFRILMLRQAIVHQVDDYRSVYSSDNPPPGVFDSQPELIQLSAIKSVEFEGNAQTDRRAVEDHRCSH